MYVHVHMYLSSTCMYMYLIQLSSLLVVQQLGMKVEVLQLNLDYRQQIR